MSIDSSVAIAEVEAELRVQATYFVMVRSELYNPFSRRALDGLDRIVDLGHHIGLHLDASLYDGDPDSLDQAAQTECTILETLINEPVTIISFHRPSQALLGLDRRVACRHHTYEPRFFKEIGYCSDSKGGWHHGHPLDHDAVRQGHALQLLTHPIWWQASPRESVREKLDRFALRRFDLLRAELARNCETYPKEFEALDPGT